MASKSFRVYLLGEELVLGCVFVQTIRDKVKGSEAKNEYLR